MIYQEINKAIAEFLGWKIVIVKDDDTGASQQWWMDVNGKLHAFPDYCDDLNAMHEAEKWLIEKEGDYFYTEALMDVVRSDTESPFKGAVLICATAHQRAEAFLKTIGKWRD